MAFSATDWRSRMNYYDGYNSSFTWSALGAAQGDRTYQLVTTNGYGGASAKYTQCTTDYETPNVEAFYVYSSWAVGYIVYQYYTTEFDGSPSYTSYSGTYSSGNWYTYWSANNSYLSLGSTYIPTTTVSYTVFYGGFPYNYYEEYTNYFFTFNGITSISPTTFYNYASGPYNSYYKFTLVSGINYNYPYQVVGKNC